MKHPQEAWCQPPNKRMRPRVVDKSFLCLGHRLTLLVATLAVAEIAAAPVWDGTSLPITIETLRDVAVKSSERKPESSYGQERGTLYSRSSFHIAKGQRFQMIAILGEGGCRIEFQGALHELTSCPWVPGFTDTQADVFRIVAFEGL